MNKELMADDATDEVVTESDEIEEVEAPEIEDENTTEDGADDEQETPELAAEQEAETGGLVVSLGEEEDEDDQSQPFRDMRQELREAKRELKELKASKQVETMQEVGEKPTLQDFDFDADKFEAALLDWNGRRQEAETKAKAEQEAVEKMASEYQENLASYKSRAKALPVKDFDEVEEVVREALPESVQSIIIDNAADPALMVYAMGKNPSVMADLPKGQSVRDIAKAAFALGAMEKGMKVTGMKPKPKPEGRVSGGVKPVTSGQKHLEKLRDEAAKTGDMTKVIAYKRKLAREK